VLPCDLLGQLLGIGRLASSRSAFRDSRRRLRLPVAGEHAGTVVGGHRPVRAAPVSPPQIGETVSDPHAPPAVPGEHVGCQSKQPTETRGNRSRGTLHVLPTHWASVSESPHSPPAVPLAHSGAVPRQPRASIVAPSCADASPPTFAG